MTSVLFNGKKHLVPSCWEEVTVKQYVSILKDWEPELDIADRDYFKLLNILTDNKYHYDRSVENEVTLISLIGWVIFQPAEFREASIPLVLNYKGKLVDVPREIKDLSIGQNIHLRREIDKTRIIEENIAIATAIFLQPKIDEGKFDLTRAKEVSKEIEQMPITLIFPIGFFLLSHVLMPGRNSVPIWKRVSFSLKRILRRQ